MPQIPSTPPSKLFAKRVRVGMISLGCPKTLVDSELILGKLDPSRFELVRSADSCEVVLVNTCSFIREAQQESIDRILELIELKKSKKIRSLVVMGCLVQEFPQALKKEFQEVDAFIGSGDYQKIPDLIEQAVSGRGGFELGDPGYLPHAGERRVALTPLYSRYLKVSEGCDHVCTFCTIPSFRGKHRSRPIADVIREAEVLAAEGAKELILTGQDTSDYGRDFSGKFLLPELLQSLNEVPGIEWIRVMYVYPSCVTEKMMESIASLDRVCKYLDMPLQHASDRMLTAMRRGITKRRTAALLEKLRQRIPGLALRTTFLVGFPGESERDFEELLGLMQSVRFERAGIFKYSREARTPAAALPGQISEKIKEERFAKAMLLQQEIARQIHAGWVGKTLPVLVEKVSRGKKLATAQGRSCYDAPEIDGTVTIHSRKVLKEGSILPVKITGAKEYDLEGQI